MFISEGLVLLLNILREPISCGMCPALGCEGHGSKFAGPDGRKRLCDLSSELHEAHSMPKRVLKLLKGAKKVSFDAFDVIFGAAAADLIMPTSSQRFPN